jgi:hypothetical protein
MKPAFVFYTDRFISAGNGGESWGPIVLIRPKYKDDRGLLEHELQHSRIFWQTLGLSALMYWLFPAAKLAQEVECYKIQLKVTTEDKKLNVAQVENLTLLFAGFISTKYGLSISVTDALKLLL